MASNRGMERVRLALQSWPLAGSPRYEQEIVSNALTALEGIGEQLEALRPYVQHRSTCILNVSQSVLREASWCDCGLTEVLNGL